jgi:hypothetical protein
VDVDDPQTSVEWLLTLDLQPNTEAVLMYPMMRLDELEAENRRYRRALEQIAGFSGYVTGAGGLGAVAREALDQ